MYHGCRINYKKNKKTELKKTKLLKLSPVASQVVWGTTGMAYSTRHLI